MKVRATRRGFYDLTLWRPGDVFELNDPRDLSPRWMAVVAEHTPERRQSAQDAIDRIFEERFGVRPGDVDVAVQGEDQAGEVLHDGDPWR